VFTLKLHVFCTNYTKLTHNKKVVSVHKFHLQTVQQILLKFGVGFNPKMSDEFYFGYNRSNKTSTSREAQLELYQYINCLS
jgi:hypothetical protein